MKIVELIIDEEADVFGIDAISLVNDPAIEANFVALKEQPQRVQFAEVDSDKHLLVGPALIPDKPIYRQKDGEEYYVYFSKATVRRAMELYLKAGFQRNATLEHIQPLQGLTLVESWIVEDPEKDKSALYGMELPVGTWCTTLKVDNEELWQEFVKTGKVLGFSIEGYFTEKMELAHYTTEPEVQLSFNDYPKSVSNNAKRGIALNEKVNNKCAEQTGKVRAQQLANGERVSMDTVKRMYSFLSRHEENYDPSDTSACGTISYLLWGGKAGLAWAKKKMREAELLSAVEAVLAEVGPRGGVNPSKKAPKSATPNPNPKRGSDKNKPGAAASEGKVKVPKEVETTLQNKSDEFNERYKDKLGYGVSVSKLKVVYQRGVGAFQTSHSPNVTSSRQWAMARVNAFLYLVKNGRPQNKKYDGDNDLLPEGHPKSEK